MWKTQKSDQKNKKFGRHNPGKVGARVDGVLGRGAPGLPGQKGADLHGEVRSMLFIPEFLAGFLLLHRAGLDPQEKANILAAIRGEFSTASVGRALREQWSDEDLMRRDKSKMGAAYFANDQDDEVLFANEDDDQVLENMDADEREAYFSEQEKVDEALVVIQAQKATLKEARWKQRQMKLGRNFFPPKAMPKGQGKGYKAGGGPIKCFNCGGPHKVAECPKRKGTSSAAQNAEEQAEIAFHAYTGVPGERWLQPAERPGADRDRLPRLHPGVPLWQHVGSDAGHTRKGRSWRGSEPLLWRHRQRCHLFFGKH